MKQKRVVFTGIGVVSSSGVGRQSFWDGLIQGKPNMVPVSLFDVSNIASKHAFQIADFQPDKIIGATGLRNLDRTTTLALCAAKLALEDANIELKSKLIDDMGVVLSSNLGSVWSISEFDKQSLIDGPRSVNPALFANTVINSPASQISIKFGIKGFNTTIANGFSSSLGAIQYAYDFINLNRVNLVLVGGVEELCEQIFKGFYKRRKLSASKGGDEINCPFDKRRNGFVLGEGAVLFLIEEYEHAKQRNAKIYGEIKGFGTSFQKTIINDSVESKSRSINSALKEADLKAGNIDAIFASANSSQYFDRIEANVINANFNGNQVPVCAPKSMVGETFSASCSFSVAASLLALNKNIIIPTANYENTDDRVKLNCSNSVREFPITNVLVNGFDVSSQQSCLILSKEE